MGKIRKFFGLFACLFTIFLTASAFAATNVATGFDTCTDQRVYTSCSAGYTLTGGTCVVSSGGGGESGGTSNWGGSAPGTDEQTGNNWVGECAPSQYEDASGNCVCPSGTTWANNECVMQSGVTCPANQVLSETYGYCTCPDSTAWDGSTCVSMPMGACYPTYYIEPSTTTCTNCAEFAGTAYPQFHDITRITLPGHVGGLTPSASGYKYSTAPCVGDGCRAPALMGTLLVNNDSYSWNTNDGVIFTGWNTSADGTGTHYAPGEYIDCSSPKVYLYAQWRAPTCAYTNGVAYTSGNVLYGTNYTHCVGHCDAGYDVNGGVISNSDADVNMGGLITSYGLNGVPVVTGECIPGQYNITLDPNGGSGGTSAVTARYMGTMVVQSIETPTQDGYNFRGYYRNQDGTGTKYYDEDGVATSAIWSETTYGTLYAKWEAEGYQIKYNINNAHLSYLSTTSGAVPSTQDDCQIGVPCTIAGRNTLWNDKYVFAGWNTYSGVAMGVEYPIGSTNSITRDQDAAGTTINLYAAWIEPNCVANNVQSAVPTVDSNNKVTCDIYCADGFSVTGGTDTNRDGELVGNPNIVTVSAGEDGMCKPRVFTVELDPNGGTAGSTTSVTVEFGSAMTEQLTGQGQLPTYAGKTFTGFFDQYGTRYYNADGTPYTNTTYANYNIDTLYAQWEDAAYTVQYDITTATGGTAPADTTCSFGVACTLAGRGDIYNSTKIFVGWKDASGTTYDAGETITKSASDVTNGVIVLTPNWAETTCTINYGSSNGKSVSSENKLTCTGICTNGYSGVSETSIDTAISATGNAGETSVTADCIPRKTTLRFIKNTSTSDNTLVTTTTLTHGAAWTNLSFSQPTRTGYTLKGWYTSRDGGGTPMYNADGTVYNPTNVQNLTWTGTPQATSTVNLYAVWTPNVLTITLNKNASDATAGTGTVYLKYATGWYSNSGATTVISTVTTPTRTGYTFDGYYTNTTGGSQIIDKDGVILDNKTTFTSVNYPLYAHWTPNTYRVVLNVNGGTTNGTPSTVYLKYATGWYSAVDANGNATGSQLTSLTSTPEYNELYNFNGYTITSTGGDTIIDADGNFVTTDTALTMTTTNGTSIYAQWVQGGVYVECSAGYYVKSGTTTCTICPANNWCPGVARQMVPTTGPTSNLGLNACDTAGGYGTSGATGKSAQTDCKKTCTLQCTQPACPSVATECTYGTSDKTGTMNEVTKTCSETVANTCPMTVTCPAGYTATNNGTANADCVPNVLTITLDKNASDATAGTGTVYLKYATGWYSNAGATTVISTVTTPTRTGYTFDGYYTGNTQIIDRTGAILSGKTTFTTTNATLTAKWTAKTMAVTFNANCSGVTANPASATYAYGTNYNLATVSNNLCGNSSFAGWQLQNVSGTPADETAIYGAGAQYTLPASLDSVMGTATLQFVAQWSTNTCTVTNGTGTVSGNTCNVTCNFGYSQTGGTDTKSSFTQTITNGSLTVECKPITLYTVTLSDTVNNKTQKIYKIHGANIYYSSDVRGSTNPDNSKVTSVTRPTASLKTFGGYFANQNGVGTQYIDETGAFLTALTNYSGNMTIYAQFTDCKPCTSTDSATCGNVSVLNNVCVYTATCKEGYDTVIASSLSPTAGASAVTPQCTPKVLTITLNKNASDATAGTGTVYLKYATGWYSNSGATTAISTVTTPTRTGYAFDGYYTTGNVQIIDRTGAILSGKTTFTTTNATLTAKWTPNTYTVKFDSTGGSTVADVTATYAAAMPAITAPTRTGYKFLGFWDTDATSGGNQYYTANGTSAKNWDKTSGATLYARWSANTYTVKFDSKGGSAVADVTATYAAAMPAITAPTRTGYTFLGFWDTDATSGGNQYYTASGTSAKNWDKASGATLYARWSANTNTVTLDPNGGTAGSTTRVTATYNANLPTIAAAGLPTRTGYTFEGYWDAKTGGNQYYNASGTGIKTWTQNGGGTLYARWSANTYTVTLDPNGGTAGSTTSVTATYNANLPTIAAAGLPTRTGYTFEGYWDAKTGGNQYYTKSGTSAKNWDKTSGATLYARWSANTYTVKFDSKGGSAVADVTATYAAAMPAITAPTRTGYTFLGFWDTDATSGGNQYYTKSGTSAKNWDKTSGATLYARWSANTYTVKFDSKGGSAVADVTATYAAAMPAITAPTRTGYTFLGFWDTDATSGGNQYYTKSGTSAKNWDKTSGATLYARWSANTYTVKFDSKGGSAVADVTATYAAAMPAITAPTRTGYTFLGFWDTDATSGGNQYYTKSGTSAKNWDKTSGATLYARWSTNTYTVTLDPNGGTAGSTTSVTATYNANLPTIAAAGLPTRTGYTFAGYWDDASGGEQYYDASGTGIKTWTQNGGGTLYAHWTANTYTVKFDSKGGSTVADVTATYAAAVPTITAPKRTGYKFLGFWDTDATSGGNQYYTESGTSAKNWDKASGATLYARWSANTYTVKFDSTGGSTVADVTATYAAAMPAITAPTRTGYTFEGYWDAKTGGNQYYTKSGTSAKNWDKASGATLYARWNANTYTVNLMPNWPDDETLTGKVDANPTNVSLTYAVGWSVDKLTSKPDVLGYDFQGYYTVATATGGIMVVDKNGNFQTSQDALTITTENNATVYARWTNGTISCPARTYYAGTGTACTECTADHYCPGVETVSVNNGQIQGRTVCPDGGKSDAGAAAATECHKIVDYKAEHGSGHQDCYYDGSKYATGCRTKTITKCDAGYWLAEATNEDCSEAGYGKYSVADSLTRTDCPNNGKTTTTTSGAVTNCYLAGLACTVPHGNGRQTCYHNDDASMTDASAYNVCEACVVDTCDDGYENKDKKECVGCLGGTYCKGGIKTDCPAGHPKSDNLSYVVTQCYRDCLKPENAASVTGRVYSDADATSDGVHTCQTTCAAGFELKPNDNSDLVTCVPCEANYVCPGENVKTKCSVATGDELYRYSATGTSDKLMCYAQCELAAHAETMQGFNYYSGINTCAIKTCEVDYELYQERCAPTKCPPHQELVDHDCIACAYEPRALTYLPDTNCMVDLCEPGYHAEGRYCIYNVRECEAPHATDARREWNKRLNGYGSCIIHECEDGYHIESNACVQDMMACEIENGTGIKTWDADNNAWGECSAAACAPGYTDDPSLTDEKDKRCGRCKNAFDEDNEIAASSYVRECEIASCMYQGEKYALEDNQCVLICEDGRDDETGTMHWNASRGKCERTCKAGFTMW